MNPNQRSHMMLQRSCVPQMTQHSQINKYYIYVDIHVYIYTHTYTCVYVFMYMYISIPTYICVYLYMYAYPHTFIHICTYTYRMHIYNLTHAKVHFSSSSDAEWMPPISQTCNTADPAQTTGNMGLTAGSSLALEMPGSEDPALHDFLLLREGKKSEGYCKLFIKLILLFTPVPVSLDLYTMKSPTKKEASTSRHFKRRISF